MRLKMADLRTRHARVAQKYMSAKGYPEIRPLGLLSVEDDECWYFYYHLPEGILELEISHDPLNTRYNRKVTAFVTDRDAVRDLLAS